MGKVKKGDSKAKGYKYQDALFIPDTKCKNCGYKHNGKRCPSCGRKAK